MYLSEKFKNGYRNLHKFFGFLKSAVSTQAR